MLSFQALGILDSFKICWNNCVRWRVSSVPPYLSISLDMPSGPGDFLFFRDLSSFSISSLDIISYSDKILRHNSPLQPSILQPLFRTKAS